MSLAVRIEIIEDSTGEVTQTFVKACEGRDLWDEVRDLHGFLDTALKAEFGVNSETY